MILKNCPFCGKKPELQSKDFFEPQKSTMHYINYYFVECINQECPTAYRYDSEEEAIDAWNNRANE